MKVIFVRPAWYNSMTVKIGKKIKNLIDEKGLDQTSFAAEARSAGLFYSQPTVSNICRGRRKKYDAEEAKKLADFFGVTLDYLLDETKGFPPHNGDRIPEKVEPTHKETDFPQPYETVSLPYFGEIVAGDPTETVQESRGEYHVLKHLGGENRYVLRVTGDSMYPELKDGDLVLVENLTDSKPIETYHNKVCTVLYNNESTIKKMIVTKEGVELRAVNPNHPPIFVKKGEDFKVQGQVIKLVDRDL